MLVLTDCLITDLHTTTRLRGSYVYLATPYSRYKDGLEAAFRDACVAAKQLMDERIPVFCPIAHSHPIAMATGHDPCDHGFWMAVDGVMMRRAACLLVCKMPGWDESRGVEIETLKFRDDGKRVFYAEWE